MAFMIHIAVPGRFNFETGGVSTVILRINSQLYEKIVYDYVSIGKQNKEYSDLIHKMGGDFILAVNNNIPLIKIFFTPLRIIHILKIKKYPVCYINGSAAFSMLFWGLSAKIAGIPVIIGHSHSSYMDAKLPLRIIKLILHYICKLFLPLVITDYLTCSQKAAAWMFPKPVMNKAMTIYNPVDVSKYVYNITIRNRKRAEHNLEAKLVIGHVGRFAYPKNHSFLLKVFKEVLTRRDDAVLFLIGEGPLQKEVKKEAIKLGIEKEIIFFGSTPLVHEYMQMFDILLLPSRFEGLPLVGIEAQCTGLPCIFSDIITSEINITGNSIFLSLKTSPIQWAIEIINIIESFERKDCSEEVKKNGFDIQDSAKQIEKVFYDALQRKNIGT